MTRNRKKILGIVSVLLVALIGGLFFLKVKKNVKGQGETSSNEKLLPTPSPASEKIKAIYQASRLPLLPKKEDRLSTACIDYFSSIRGVDLRMVRTFPPKSPPFPNGEGCKDIPKSLVDLNTQYIAACATLMKPQVELTQKIWFESLPPCVIALFNYRAQLTHFLTRNIPLEDIDDPMILLDKMMATLSGTDYKLNEKLANRLLELEPSLVSASEMVVMSKFMQAQTEARGNPSDRKWEELEHSLQKLIEIGAINAKQVLEWQLMMNLSKNADPEESRRYAERMASQYPEWGLPLYYEAWALYNSQDQAGAAKKLQEARKKDPSDLRAKEALEKIYKKDPSPFSTNFSVTFPKEVFE